MPGGLLGKQACGLFFGKLLTGVTDPGGLVGSEYGFQKSSDMDSMFQLGQIWGKIPH